MADSILVMRVQYPADLTSDQRSEIEASASYHLGLMLGRLSVRIAYPIETEAGWLGADPFINVK